MTFFYSRTTQTQVFMRQVGALNVLDEWDINEYLQEGGKRQPEYSDIYCLRGGKLRELAQRFIDIENTFNGGTVPDSVYQHIADQYSRELRRVEPELEMHLDSEPV